MAWDTVPLAAASALPRHRRIRRVPTPRPSTRPTPTCRATTARPSRARSTPTMHSRSTWSSTLPH
eukprot:1089565-Prymnesium_polylepis.1